MQPSMLEEIAQIPNPYPIVSEMQLPEVWQLCQQARDLAWDPTKIDYSDVRDADLPDEVRRAGAEWWSLRAWMEHGATPYGAERYREAVASHQPFEVKQHIVNFMAEELRHHEASFRVAKAIGGSVADYEPTPRADYFQTIIPKFHDEKDEKAMSFFGGLAVNTLFEQLSGELLQARYENARFESIREACKLILRDEARHIQFGRIVMRRFFPAAVHGGKSAARRQGIQEAARVAPQRRLRGGEPARRRKEALGAQPRAGRGIRPGGNPSGRGDGHHQDGPGQDPRRCRAVERSDSGDP